MTTCRNNTVTLACFDDGAGNIQTLYAHHAYDGNGQRIAVYYTDAADNVINTSAGTVTLGACPNEGADHAIVREHFRLDAANPTFTVTAPFKSVTPILLRDNPDDPNDGSLASVSIDGVVHYPGQGDVYTTVLPRWDTSHHEAYSEDMVFSVSGGAVVDVWVTREA